MAASAIGRRRVVERIVVRNSLLFLCDMQEKFRSRVKYFDEIVAVSNRVLRAAMALEVPVIITEQYPQGLGPTAKQLGLDEFGLKPIAKTQFCMLVPEVERTLEINGGFRSSVILCGIESHVCVQQTALTLLERGYDVHLVVDATSSQNLVNRKYAFKFMRDCGVLLTTSESLILSLLKDSAHPKFRQLQKELLMTPAPDTGLSL